MITKPTELTMAADSVDWRMASKLVGILIFTLALFSSTTVQLAALWDDTARTTYTHGWLVLLVTIYWLIDLSRDIQRIAPKFSLIGLWVYLALAALWLVARAASVQVVQFALLPLLAIALSWAFLGLQTAMRAAVPLAYLYFAIPFWELFTPLLQGATVMAVQGALFLVGIPAAFDGNIIHLQMGSFIVQEGCSGLHFLMVALALAVFCNHVYRVKKPLLLVLFAISLAILTNWIRVFVIVVAGYLTNMQHYLVTVDHYKFGWILFVVMMMPFFFFASKMRQRVATTTHVDGQSNDVGHPVSMSAIASTLLAVVAIPVLAEVLMYVAQNSPPIAFAIPSTPAGWRVLPGARTDWSPKFLNADTVSMLRIQQSQMEIDVYRAGYRFMRQDGKLGHYDNSITGEGLHADGSAQSAGVGTFVEMKASNQEDQRSLVWFSYFVGGHWSSKPIVGQLRYAVTMWGWPAASGILAMRMNCATDCVAERQILAELTAAARLPEYLPVRVLALGGR